MEMTEHACPRIDWSPVWLGLLFAPIHDFREDSGLADAAVEIKRRATIDNPQTSH